MRRRKQRIRCAGCGQFTPSYDVIHRASAEKVFRPFCSRCLNAEMARSEGFDKFEHLPLEPVELADCAGVVHRFHFQTHLFETGVALDAFELRGEDRGGYQFQVVGAPEEDLLVLLGRLIDKMRRALSVRHIEQGELGLQIADHQVVRGTIAWDEGQDGRVPLLIVDGRQITWEAFGRMLMTYEGWQFKVEVRGMDEEL